MSQTPIILSPRPQRHPASFAKIISWTESDHIEGLSSGAPRKETYTYMQHGGLYEQRVRAGCRTMAKYSATLQYATAVRDRSLDNQAPPWPPAPRAILNAPSGEQARPQATTTSIPTRRVSLAKATADPLMGQSNMFVGRDGTLWPMPPPECLPGGMLSKRKPVPVEFSPFLPASRPLEPRASMTAASPSPVSDDEVESSSGSEYSQDSDNAASDSECSQDEQEDEETRTPALDDELSLADLGRQWYASFGKEVGASPLPLEPAEAGPWATAGRPAPNVMWLPQAAAQRKGITVEAAAGPSAGGAHAGFRHIRGREGNPWSLLPDEDVRWGAP